MRKKSLRARPCSEATAEGEVGGTTQKGRKAKELLGERGLERGLTCLDDAAQQPEGAWLGHRASKGSMHLGLYSTRSLSPTADRCGEQLLRAREASRHYLAENLLVRAVFKKQLDK